MLVLLVHGAHFEERGSLMVAEGHVWYREKEITETTGKRESLHKAASCVSPHGDQHLLGRVQCVSTQVASSRFVTSLSQVILHGDGRGTISHHSSTMLCPQILLYLLENPVTKAPLADYSSISCFGSLSGKWKYGTLLF